MVQKLSTGRSVPSARVTRARRNLPLPGSVSAEVGEAGRKRGGELHLEIAGGGRAVDRAFVNGADGMHGTVAEMEGVGAVVKILNVVGEEIGAAVFVSAGRANDVNHFVNFDSFDE